MNTIKRQLVDQHNRKYEKQRQYKLALQIMDIEGLVARDHQAVVKKRKLAASTAMTVAMISTTLTMQHMR